MFNRRHGAPCPAAAASLALRLSGGMPDTGAEAPRLARRGRLTSPGGGGTSRPAGEALRFEAYVPPPPGQVSPGCRARLSTAAVQHLGEVLRYREMLAAAAGRGASALQGAARHRCRLRRSAVTLPGAATAGRRVPGKAWPPPGEV